MNAVRDDLKSFAVWWLEGMAALGTRLLEAFGPPGDFGTPRRPEIGEGDPEGDRQAWEDERARLALSPWWM